MGNEFNQFINTGASVYLRDVWNFLDVLGFGMELVAAFAWIARSRDEHAVRGLLAVASLILLAKTLYFARGFPQWGPLVRGPGSSSLFVIAMKPVTFFLCVCCVTTFESICL